MMIMKLQSVLFTTLIFLTACSGGGPQFPFDTGYSDSADLAQEFEEGRRQAEQHNEYLEQKWDKMAEEGAKDADPEGYDPACDEPGSDPENWVRPAYCNDRDGSSGSTSNGDTSGCPDGCTSHKSDCDIKGNISFNSGEKIYHVPGQNFYSETQINPNKGERWFCSEAEARANGWRKAKNQSIDAQKTIQTLV